MNKTRYAILSLTLVAVCQAWAQTAPSPLAAPHASAHVAAEPEEQATEAPGDASGDGNEFADQSPQVDYLADMPDYNTPEFKTWEKAFVAKADSSALIALGDFYTNNVEAPVGLQQAQALYEKAVKKGDKQAYYSLAMLFEQDDNQQAKVLHYTELGAKAGQEDCQFNLGSYYEEGSHGLKQDLAKALYWYDKAASADYEDAQLRLGEMYYLGQGIPKDYVKARHYLEPLAEGNIGSASFYLGQMYRLGQGVKPNIKKALVFLEDAADLSNHEASMALGDIYANGEGVPVNIEQAKDWYSSACEDGLNQACARLMQLNKIAPK